tara:strand:+ start:401 stop:574 length:174 start_codon:yes stop_codon:yes gene_type:complete
MTQRAPRLSQLPTASEAWHKNEYSSLPSPRIIEEQLIEEQLIEGCVFDHHHFLSIYL